MSELKTAYRRVMDDHFPDEMKITLGDMTLVYKKQTWKIEDEQGNLVEKGLRYGENPGQEAALYRLVNGNVALGGVEFIGPGKELVSGLDEDAMLQFGKHPGKTNLTDIDSAMGILRYLSKRPTVVIVKHNNPCGVASASSLAEAYARANMADRVAAFGGAASFNRAMDKETAEILQQNYLEVVAAPEYEEGVLDILSKKKNLRIIRIKAIDRLEEYALSRFLDFKGLMDGGLILQQSAVNTILSKEDFLPAKAEYQGQVYKPVREPTDREYEDLLFGWAVEQGVTSNSVLYIKDQVTVGIGTGEQDRVGVAEIAIFKAYTKYVDALCFKRHGRPYKELELDVSDGKADKALIEEIDQEAKAKKAGLPASVMISDAFFPYRDGVDVAIKEGISAIAHPGGAMRDWESIQAVNQADPPVAMVFTGQRAFKH
ncbi:MAG: IMP cyclohydrolase [Deltaproteobacteria bacterium]|nr:IMP cyclohydrolase [Deltaproteobacteria bacterium]MBW2050637.1 IMP cyclohydrolase [Deltaproteobacteria bacterium]MBW2139469.1 IMP cyclohydrolase [Deltaproteobacteria bacterium]MBW2322218.1 IMP cyclohydrolase [Deltaproteobacteria bacterium]